MLATRYPLLATFSRKYFPDAFHLESRGELVELAGEDSLSRVRGELRESGAQPARVAAARELEQLVAHLGGERDRGHGDGGRRGFGVNPREIERAAERGEELLLLERFGQKRIAAGRERFVAIAFEDARGNCDVPARSTVIVSAAFPASSMVNPSGASNSRSTARFTGSSSTTSTRRGEPR